MARVARTQLPDGYFAYFTKKSMHGASPLLLEDRASFILEYFAYFFLFNRKKVSITKRRRWYGPHIAKTHHRGNSTIWKK